MQFHRPNNRRAIKRERESYLGSLPGDPPLPIESVSMELQEINERRFVLWCSLIAGALLVLSLCVLASKSIAQEHHHRHHALYKNWTNKSGQGCCNDQDCGELAAENERDAGELIEVRIEGEWCPVLPTHYLRSGNAPNWSSSHVCVARPVHNDKRGPCERFLCYQPRPGG